MLAAARARRGRLLRVTNAWAGYSGERKTYYTRVMQVFIPDDGACVKRVSRTVVWVCQAMKGLLSLGGIVYVQAVGHMTEQLLRASLRQWSRVCRDSGDVGEMREPSARPVPSASGKGESEADAARLGLTGKLDHSIQNDAGSGGSVGFGRDAGGEEGTAGTSYSAGDASFDQDGAQAGAAGSEGRDEVEVEANGRRRFGEGDGHASSWMMSPRHLSTRVSLLAEPLVSGDLLMSREVCNAKRGR